MLHYGLYEQVINNALNSELADTMSMCGAKTLADITRDMVFVK